MKRIVEYFISMRILRKRMCVWFLLAEKNIYSQKRIHTRRKEYLLTEKNTYSQKRISTHRKEYLLAEKALFHEFINVRRREKDI